MTSSAPSGATAAPSSTRRWRACSPPGAEWWSTCAATRVAGIGLVAKLQAYALQDAGRDTVDANLDLGLPADARHYGAASQVLRDLGVTRVRLLTNNPDKSDSLEDFGVARRGARAADPAAHPAQPRLPQTKRDRMGHQMPDLPTTVETPAVVDR